MISPVATGINRAIKPDLLLPGGRQAMRAEPSTDGGPRPLSVAISRRPPGLRVAAPGLRRRAGPYVHTTGTSGATALAGHHTGALLQRLDVLRAAYGLDFPDAELDAVLLKSALAQRLAGDRPPRRSSAFCGTLVSPRLVRRSRIPRPRTSTSGAGARRRRPSPRTHPGRPSRRRRHPQLRPPVAAKPRRHHGRTSSHAYVGLADPDQPRTAPTAMPRSI